MVLLTFSFTGENTTGQAVFTIAQEYKFKNIIFEDVKYHIASDALEENIASTTADDGSSLNTHIMSPLGLKFDFLDSNDCVLYSLADGSGETLNTATNITGLIPIGRANKLGHPSYFTGSANETHNFPYKLVSNRPQTWAVGKTITIDLYYRDVGTDGLVKDWGEIKDGPTDSFGDICSIDITLRLE